jgi:hypothetical protein
MAFGIGRRELIAGLGSAALAWPLGARAQQAAMPVLGFLQESGVPHTAPTSDDTPPLLAAFRKGLTEASYVDGKNLAIEYRFTSFERSEAARDLVRLKVDVIFAAGPELTSVVGVRTDINPGHSNGANDPKRKSSVSWLRQGKNLQAAILPAARLCASRRRKFLAAGPSAPRTI